MVAGLRPRPGPAGSPRLCLVPAHGPPPEPLQVWGPVTVGGRACSPRVLSGEGEMPVPRVGVWCLAQDPGGEILDSSGPRKPREKHSKEEDDLLASGWGLQALFGGKK